MSTESLGTIASRDWHPFSQNHDPSFISAMQGAYADGYDSALAKSGPDMAKEIAQLRADKAELIIALKKLLQDQMGCRIYDAEGAQSVSTDSNHPTLRQARAIIAKHSKP